MTLLAYSAVFESFRRDRLAYSIFQQAGGSVIFDYAFWFLPSVTPGHRYEEAWGANSRVGEFSAYRGAH